MRGTKRTDFRLTEADLIALDLVKDRAGVETRAEAHRMAVKHYLLSTRQKRVPQHQVSGQNSEKTQDVSGQQDQNQSENVSGHNT